MCAVVASNTEFTSVCGPRPRNTPELPLLVDLSPSPGPPLMIRRYRVRNGRLNDACQRRCAEVIAESGGFVAQYLGDGILAAIRRPTRTMPSDVSVESEIRSAAFW